MKSVLKRAYEQMIGFFLFLLDKSRNPVNDARKIVHELDDHIEKIESVAAEVLAQKKGIEDRKAKAEAGAKEFGGFAVQASKKGDKDLARDCLKRQMEYEHQVSELEKEFAHVKPRAEKVQERLSELRKAHASASRELTSLEARYAISKADMKASKMMKEVKGFDAGGELAKARDAVRNSENLSDAVDEVNTTDEEKLSNRVDEMNGTDSNDELERRLAELADK